METTITNPSMAASAWAPSELRVRVQGNGLPFAGYPTVSTGSAYQMKAIASHGTTLATAHVAGSTGDAGVPEPRGRKR
jgi:hypothetical protein